jgi:UDP-N-acetylmuramoyl-tripeptide--D-alanyl-D-alanine ligase
MPTFSPIDLAQWSGGHWDPAPPATTIEGVSSDTRTIAPGNLYLALSGCNFDGHVFVDEAFRKGASSAVVNNAKHFATGGSERKCILRVKDTSAALCNIAASYRIHIAPEIVAVTGSAGKSTVKEMIAQILSSVMPVARTKGNWNNNIGLPLSILGMEKSARAGVFEIGTNHPGELAPLCSLLQPSWGVVSNVGPVHIEFFGSIEAIADEKATLLRSLPANGVAVLNRDGGCFEFLRSTVSCKVITISLRQSADYTCSSWDHRDNGVIIAENATGETFAFRLPLPGEYNVMNAMLAIAVARGHGMKWEPIKTALESYTPLPMRWQREKVATLDIINDAYNANPMSMRASIRAFAGTEIAGEKWLLLAGMLELGNNEKQEHIALGKFLCDGKWKGLIVVGELGKLIAIGAEEAGFDKSSIFRCDSNADAARVIMENIHADDAILFKASRRMRLEEIVELLKHQD